MNKLLVVCLVFGLLCGPAFGKAYPITEGGTSPIAGIVLPEAEFSSIFEKAMQADDCATRMELLNKKFDVMEEIYRPTFWKDLELNRWAAFIGGILVGVYIYQQATK